MGSLYCFLFIWAFISTIFGFFIFFELWDYNSDLKLWWLPQQLSKEWCREHEVGNICYIILSIVINIILFPAMLIVLFLNGFIWSSIYFFCFIVWVFRKKE